MQTASCGCWPTTPISARWPAGRLPARRTSWRVSSPPSMGSPGHHRPARTRPRRRDRRHPLRQEQRRPRYRGRAGPAAGRRLSHPAVPDPAALGTGRPRRDRAGGRAALQVDGEELTGRQTITMRARARRLGRRAPAPHRRGRPDCPRPGRAGPHVPHPRAGGGGDGGPEPNRPSHSRDPAPVDP
jgi:hypothetical protein